MKTILGELRKFFSAQISKGIQRDDADIKKKGNCGYSGDMGIPGYKISI